MSRKLLGVIAIIAGLLGGGFGLYDALTAEDSVLDAAAEEIAPQFGVSVEEVRAILDEAIDAGQLDISISIGLIIVIVGGAIAVIGGVLMLGRGSAPAAPAAAEPVSATAMPYASASSEATASAPMEPAEPAATPPDPVPPVTAPPESGSPPRRRRRHRRRHSRPPPGVNVEEISLDTRGRRVVDVTDRVAAFASANAGDGLLHVFAPHATAGVALMETESGSEGDLEELLERVLPRDDRYRHRHGSTGHGGDHLLPVLVSPSLVLAVEDGRLVLGTWQRVVLVDPNRENDVRRLRLSFVGG
jgi:secondary thiamine-phosphate synthase enzyme